MRFRCSGIMYGAGYVTIMLKKAPRLGCKGAFRTVQDTH
jgi:hypothetical protein